MELEAELDFVLVKQLENRLAFVVLIDRPYVEWLGNELDFLVPQQVL